MPADRAVPAALLRIRHVPGPPTVALRAWLRGGAQAERTAGEALVTARMLTEGTRRRSWRRLAREAEERGQVIDSYGGHEASCVAIDALAHDLERALDDLAEMTLAPAWPAGRFRFVIDQTAAELESMLDRPEVRTGRAFLEALYGDHPYGRPLQGNLAALRALRPADCHSFHQRSLAKGLVVTIAGAVDEDAVRRATEQRFDQQCLIPGTGDPYDRGTIDPPPEPTGRTVRLRLPPGDQAHLLCGRLTTPRAHPDRPALDLLGVALGAGTGVRGRLVDRIREREGLAYEIDISTAAGAGFGPGRFSVYAATTPRQVAQVEAAIRDELARLIAGGLEKEELEEARAYLVGSAPFRIETARQIADRLAEEAFYGPTMAPDALEEQWRAVTPRAIRDAAERHLRPDLLTLAIGLPRNG